MDRGTFKRLPVIKASSHVASDTPVAALLWLQLTTKQMRQVTCTNTCEKQLRMQSPWVDWMNYDRFFFFQVSFFFPPRIQNNRPVWRDIWLSARQMQGCFVLKYILGRIVMLSFSEEIIEMHRCHHHRFLCWLSFSLVAPATKHLSKEGLCVQSKTILVHLQGIICPNWCINVACFSTAAASF